MTDQQKEVIARGALQILAQERGVLDEQIAASVQSDPPVTYRAQVLGGEVVAASLSDLVSRADTIYIAARTFAEKQEAAVAPAGLDAVVGAE
ncbi:hypothetical protein [Piscinibacter koreensis]|uniref:Uncharacterized protein n=1 Tax=Piscinibacter koreensis TaxID=2742824 RepID=A0A7Y6TZA8_9BURK|nr:hypothetical protein [Schlegelella koreensis]NUZ09108.1 hypothetical protein [Schlegelella koreensis]